MSHAAGSNSHKHSMHSNTSDTQSRGKWPRWLWRLVSWLDAKVDRVVELGVDDFERKCDAATRTFSTCAFTFCFVVIAIAVALKWALAS